ISSGDLLSTVALAANINCVQCTDFTADGKWLVVGHGGGTMRLWSVPNGNPFPYPPGHSAPVTSVAYSPATGLVASSSEDGTVKVRRVSDGKVVSTLSGHSAAVTGVAFSP